MDTKFFELFERDQWIWQTFSGKAYKEQNTKNGRDSVAKVIKTPDVASFEQQAKALQAQGADIFFQVNIGPTRKGADVTEVAALFLDLDGAPINPVIDDAKAGVIPRPNAIVNTRPRRYHVYWLVEDCATAQFRQAQKLLANRYGGDPAIHDLSRVMRAPGTYNNKTTTPHPVTAKILHPNYCSMHDLIDINYGVQRTPGAVAAQMMGDDWENLKENAYDVDQITAGNRTEAIMSEAGRYIAITPGAKYAEVMTHLKTWEKEKLRPGDPPKTQESWDSEISPGVMKFIAAQEKEREYQAELNAQKVAAARRADADVGDAWEASIENKPMTYEEFCERFVWCSTENSVYDLTKQANADPLKMQNFKVWAQPHKIGKTSIAARWLNDMDKRRTVHVSTFQPRPYNEDLAIFSRIVTDYMTGVPAYNTYQQPMLKPVDKCDDTIVSVALDHINYLCNYDKATYEHMLNWIAFTVQKPHLRIPSVPLIVSKYGVGKGWFCKLMTTLLGEKNVNPVDMSKFSGFSQFNGFMVNCKLVVLHEVKGPRSAVEALKSLITEESIDVNIKYGANKKCFIYANMLMFSNHDDALPLDEGDRRFWVIRHMHDPKSPDYYTRLFNWLTTANMNHIFRYFLDRDISQWEYAAPAPMTQAKKAMIQGARHEDEQHIAEAIEFAEGAFEQDILPGDVIIRHIEKVRGALFEPREKSGFVRKLGMFCRLVGRVYANGKRHSMYAVRHFDKYQSVNPDALQKYFASALFKEQESNKLKQVR